jgi:hypothetical protein
MSKMSLSSPCRKHVKRTPQPGRLDGVIDEIADVEMMLAQMRLAGALRREVQVSGFGNVR